MRTLNARVILTTAGAVLILPLFALAVITGAHANDLAQTGLDDLLLVGLALGGAIASLVNGMGRRAVRVNRAEGGKQSRGAEARTQRSSVSAINF